MGFSRQEYWSGFPFPSPGDRSNPEWNPHLQHWQADSLPLSHQGRLRHEDTRWCDDRWRLHGTAQAKECQEPRGGKDGLFPTDFWGMRSCWHLDLRLLASRTAAECFCWLKLPSHGHLFWQSRKRIHQLYIPVSVIIPLAVWTHGCLLTPHCLVVV